MNDLSTFLQSKVPETGIRDKKWDTIAKELSRGKDIESVLLENPPDDDLEKLIVALTAKLILNAEKTIFEEVVNKERVLRLSRLLKHVLKPNTGVPIITTNYDRLIEFACEYAGLGVDTLFTGYNFARLDPKESRMSFCRKAELGKKSVFLSYNKYATVLKPHGSVDWYLNQNEPMRCALDLNLPRLIITPGLNKYRTGYDRPFDSHRERANKEIDRASRYLIIGYGFNDQHLQTHLDPHLRNGKPTVLITKELTASAKNLVSKSEQILALCECEQNGSKGTVVIRGKTQTFLPDMQMWDLNTFVKEVFE